MAVTDSTVKLAVEVYKNPGRKSGYTATYGTYPGEIRAEGATPTAAKNNLGAAIVTALTAITTARPTFARDDQDGLWVAIPAADGGSDEYRVTEDSARRCGSTSNPPATAFTSCVGVTVIPSR